MADIERARSGAAAWFADSSAPALAAVLAAIRGESSESPIAPTALVETAAWRLTVRSLGASRDGVKALLVPLLVGGFAIVADPAPSPDDLARGEAARDIFEFRVAHEVAHALFYVPGTPPSRVDAPSPDEEVFCDAFARCLVGATTTEASAGRPLSVLAAA